ncbi:hypothetical protein ACFLY4_04645 [Chloroflexota bacterium]
MAVRAASTSACSRCARGLSKDAAYDRDGGDQRPNASELPLSALCKDEGSDV